MNENTWTEFNVEEDRKECERLTNISTGKFSSRWNVEELEILQKKLNLNPVTYFYDIFKYIETMPCFSQKYTNLDLCLSTIFCTKYKKIQISYFRNSEGKTSQTQDKYSQFGIGYRLCNWKSSLI